MRRQALWCVEETPGDPWHNMATDAALLTRLNSQSNSLPVIRVYQWDRTCISVGRLQAEEPVQRLYPDLPWVRRPTGGRAVLHGQDLTVAVAARLDWLPDNSGHGVMSSHRLLMSGVMKALAIGGCAVSYGAEKPQGTKNTVLCIELAAACDLVDSASGQKVVGSAQRREGSALLQQMSIPLTLLPDRDAFVGALRAGFCEALCVEEWLRVDTPCAVCYTNEEESEGSHPWHAKF